MVSHQLDQASSYRIHFGGRCISKKKNRHMKLKRPGPANRQIGAITAIESAPEGHLRLIQVADHIRGRIE